MLKEVRQPRPSRGRFSVRYLYWALFENHRTSVHDLLVRSGDGEVPATISEEIRDMTSVHGHCQHGKLADLLCSLWTSEIIG